MPPGAFFRCRSSADCITIMSGSDLRHGQDVFDQTIHEHHAHTPIAGTRHTRFKQSGADPSTPVPWQDRHPYLRMLLGAGEVGSADNGEVGIGNDEDSIA